MGVVSSIGNNSDEVLRSLREGRCGFERVEEYAEQGLRSQVHGGIRLDTSAHIDRRMHRFMGDAAAYAAVAMQEAVADAGLDADHLSDERIGLVAGTGGGSPANQVLAVDTLRERGVRRVLPYHVPRGMTSTVAACLSTMFGIRGVSYSIVSACATGAHCIGHAADLIRSGEQDVVFAGGGEELHWALAVLFDGMGALSTAYNEEPLKASRPYDSARDGFVISGGGAMLVLEDLDHAQARGARIRAELTGYGATCDGGDMVQPSGEGAVRCMRRALRDLSAPVDYVNTHGTGTPIGDLIELRALREVFGDDVPPLSSTKSMTGHGLGAAGAQEAVYCLLMMEHAFIAPSINIDELDDSARGYPIVRETRSGVQLDTVLSNSFGFGGTNACLVLSRMRT